LSNRVDTFQVDHSALVLFDESKVGTVIAECPEDFGTLNATIQPQNIPAEQALLNAREDIYYPDLGSTAAREGLASVYEELLGRGIRGILEQALLDAAAANRSRMIHTFV
jgi:hypothetical protein